MNATTHREEDAGAPISILLDIKLALGVVQTQQAAIQDEQNEARVSRRLMHQKQDEINVALEAVTQKVNAVQESVKTITPTVLEHEQLRQRINGGVAVLVGLGSLALIAAGFVLKEVWAWFTAHFTWK